MSYDPVEGVHYIFDRYAFLNGIMADGKYENRLGAGSTQDEIKKACTLARAMYHPDRQSRTGAEMKMKAEQTTTQIADCERFLLNPELKSFYDTRLEEFREKRPNMISTNGCPIISLTEQFFDVGALLSDTITDTSGFEAQMKAMLQYDEKRVPQMKSLYDLMPENPQAKSLYRDALTQQLVYLTLLEDAAWAKVGYMNRKEKNDGLLIRAADYTKQVEATLQKSADRDINATIERHGAVAQIGMAKTPLQLEFNAEAAPAPAAAPGSELMSPEERFRQALDEKKTTARRNFDIRADYVREVAERKQALLSELCLLTPVEPVGTVQPDQLVYDFYLLNPPGDDGSQQALLRMEINAVDGNAGLAEIYKDGRTLADLAAQGFARAGFTVTRNPEISDMMLEVGAASQRFLDKAEKEREAQPRAPKPSAPPAP